MLSTNSGPRLLPVLLEEALPVDAVGHADHRQRPVGQMRQHERRDLRQIAQQVALGERRLLQCRVGRPVDAVQMRQLDLRRADRERHHRLWMLELLDHVVDQCVAGVLRLVRTLRELRSGLLRRAPHRLRVDVVAQPQEHRRAQPAIFGPALELHFGDELGLDPGRRAVQLGLLGKRAGLRLQPLQPCLQRRQCLRRRSRSRRATRTRACGPPRCRPERSPVVRASPCRSYNRRSRSRHC